jgi:hypothetical protein
MGQTEPLFGVEMLTLMFLKGFTNSRQALTCQFSGVNIGITPPTKIIQVFEFLLLFHY